MVSSPDTTSCPDGFSGLAGASLAGLGSFGVLTAMVDQRHLDFASGVASGGYPGLGPSGALAWSAALLILSALVFWRKGCERWLVLAAGLPCVLLVMQLTGPSEHGWRGLTFGAIGLASIAASRLASQPKVRRVMVAVLISALLPLGLRSLRQVGPEHEATVSFWQAEREVLLAQRGWDLEGEEVRVFERRLNEPVPTGWFVSPNVFSTVVLGATLVCMGLALERRAWWLAVLGASWLLVLAGSKGAFGALGVGLVVLLWQRSGRVMPNWWPFTLALGVLSLVVFRSLLPEGWLTEESLRVRGGYLRGVWHVLQAHPFGVGADGFQDAFLQVRRPVDAEEVRSAHALFADWLVILGIGALPWLLAFARTTLSMNRGACAPAEGATAGLSAALAAALALQVELSSVAGVEALWRVAGVLGAGGLAWCIARGKASVGRGVLAAAVAILVHAQLDITGVTPNALAWCALLFSMAVPSAVAGHRWSALVPASFALVCALAAWQATDSARNLAMIDQALAEQRVPDFVPDITTWPYDPEPLRAAVRLGIASAETLGSSREDLQLKANLASDPRVLHDQLLVLNPYGRTLLERAAASRAQAGDIEGARSLWLRRLEVDDAIRDPARKLSAQARAAIEDQLSEQP